VLGKPCLQRLQPPDCSANPVGKRRAVELNAMAGEDLALPIKRKVIAVFGDQDMSQEPRRGQALGNRALGGRRLVNGPAGATAVAGAADADDPQPSGHMIEHLADGLADQVQGAAAAGAGVLLDIEPPVLAGQVFRQAWSIDLRPGFGGVLHTRRKPGLSPCQIGREVFKAELQLLVVEPLGTPAKLAALQLLHDQPQPIDLRLRLGERRALGRKPAYHPLQRLHIVRQCRKIDLHAPQIYADSRVFSPSNALVSQSAAAISPRLPVAIAVPVRASPRLRSATTAAPRLATASRPAPRSEAIETRRARGVW
jgi:hypothetical protein